VRPIREIQRVAAGVFVWSDYEPEVRCECSGSALLLPDGILIIDPLPLELPARASLFASAPPLAILLTSGNHQRDSLAWAEQLSVPILAAFGAGEEVRADRWIHPGESPYPGLETIDLAGAGPGEIALLAHDGKTLVLGDAIINLGPDGPALLPPKYCLDPKAAKRSLHALGGLEPEVVLMAHGPPLVTRAAERLQALLSTI